MTNWFPHDAQALNDEKLIVLRKRHGFAGLGIFWLMVELCYEANGQIEEYKLPIIFEAYEVENGPDIWATMLELRLFNKKDGAFHSERIDRELATRNELREKRAKAGQAGGFAKSRASQTEAKEPSGAKQVVASAKQGLAKSATGQDRTGHNRTVRSPLARGPSEETKMTPTSETVAKPEKSEAEITSAFWQMAIERLWCDQPYAETKAKQFFDLRAESRSAPLRKMRVALNADAQASAQTKALAKKIFHETCGLIQDTALNEQTLSGKELAKRRSFADESNTSDSDE